MVIKNNLNTAQPEKTLQYITRDNNFGPHGKFKPEIVITK
jgi:hypothetical protein